jgi:hypothetical protein
LQVVVAAVTILAVVAVAADTAPLRVFQFRRELHTH